MAEWAEARAHRRPVNQRPCKSLALYQIEVVLSPFDHLLCGLQHLAQGAQRNWESPPLLIL